MYIYYIYNLATHSKPSAFSNPYSQGIFSKSIIVFLKQL